MRHTNNNILGMMEETSYTSEREWLKYPFDIEEESSKTPTMPTTQIGWVCPKCGSVYAPHVTTCWRCSNNTYQLPKIWC